MIRGENITLRVVQEKDLETLFHYYSDLDNRGEFFPLSLLARYLFETRTIRRLQLTAVVGNLPSKRVAERGGCAPTSHRVTGGPQAPMEGPLAQSSARRVPRLRGAGRGASGKGSERATANQTPSSAFVCGLYGATAEELVSPRCTGLRTGTL
jgi:hypothetical protein